MAIEVNGELITNAEIRAETANLRREREDSGEDIGLEDRMSLRDAAIESLIVGKLLEQELRRLGIAHSDAVNTIASIWARNVARPSSSEIRKIYRERREELFMPEGVWASHIVRNFDGEDRSVQRERVTRVRERLLAGEDFAELARTESDCPENGGDLGWFSRGTMVEEFDDVVFAAEPGKLTEVFETRFGAHVALVHNRRAAGIPAFEDAAGQLENALYEHKVNREFHKRVNALHARAVIREVA